MKRSRFLRLAACGALGAAIASPQPASVPPAPEPPKVELKGRIERIQVVRGQGMPQLELRSGDTTTRVLLGSVRYLIEQNFSPKAGDEASVRGLRTDGLVLAITVTANGRTIRLRDEDGRPVWMRGRHGKGPTR